MRLWGWWKKPKQSFQELPQQQLRSELGFGGSGVGYLLTNLGADEYLPELSFPRSITVYTRMRRSDATVQALELAITLPIRATDWDVQPASDDPTAKEAADLVYDNLFGGMTQTFDDFLRDALLALFYGFTVFEKVFEERDNYIVWRKFAPRHPQTIERFLFDETGGLAGVRQVGFDPQGRFRRVDIPIEKLLVFIWRRELGNPYGVSALRAAYKHWFLKDLAYKLQAIALERWAVGIPVGKVPAGTSEQDKQTFLQMLEAMRGHERAAMVLPEDYSVELIGAEAGQRANQAFTEAIQHHDTMIVKAVLAQFLNLGTGDVGSWALSRDHSQLFLMGLNSVAQWFADHINRYAIPQLCRLNFGEDFTDFPELTFTDLRLVLQREVLAEAIGKLVQVGILTPDRSLQEWVRDVFDMPPLPEEQPEEVELPAPETTASSDSRLATGNGKNDQSLIANRQSPSFRQSPVANRQSLSFSDPLGLIQGATLRSLSDTTITAAEQSLRNLLRQQIDALMEQVRKLIADADAGKPSALRELGRLSVPQHLVDAYAVELTKYLMDAYRAARSVYLAATSSDPTKPIPRWVDFYLQGFAQAIARQHAADLAATVGYEALRLYEESKTLGRKFSDEQIEAAAVERAANMMDDLPKTVELLTEILFEPIEVSE
jgi:phage gp29-like protein